MFLASVVQAAAGMGFGQVAGPTLLLLDPRFVPGPVIVMAIVVGGLGALRDRDGIVPGDLAAALGGRALGATAAAVLLLTLPGAAEFSLLFAGLTLLGVALSLTRWRVRPTRRALLTAGTLSGLMGTITTVGAPPMAIVYQHAPGYRTRATLNAFFSLGAAVSLVALGLGGRLAATDFALAALLAPGFVAGTWAGRRLTGFVDRRFRPLVLGIATTAAVLIVARTVIGR